MISCLMKHALIRSQNLSPIPLLYFLVPFSSSFPPTFLCITLSHQNLHLALASLLFGATGSDESHYECHMLPLYF